ncbi:MAG: hypothetical protein JWM68_4957 [Verrucomicrobiales bacterium]|nr:hypothetical protein [Verrucomicrobiales bacterium]
MKKLTQILALAVLTFGFSALHAEKVVAGPKGGRILEKTEPKAEFFVEKDKTVTVTFYDAAMKPIAAADQNVTIVADSKEGKEKIQLEKKGDVLVSKTPLPNVENGNVVVQFKQNAEAKPQNLRFKVNTSTCGECKRAEYACTCDE